MCHTKDLLLHQAEPLLKEIKKTHFSLEHVVAGSCLVASPLLDSSWIPLYSYIKLERTSSGCWSASLSGRGHLSTVCTQLSIRITRLHWFALLAVQNPSYKFPLVSFNVPLSFLLSPFHSSSSILLIFLDNWAAMHQAIFPLALI